MTLQLVARTQPMSDAYRKFVERKANYVMGKFGTEILAVRVIFEDHNGPKGGVDQECRIEAQTRRGALIVASVVDETPGQALDGAMRRVNHRIRDHLGRRKNHPRTVVSELLEAS